MGVIRIGMGNYFDKCLRLRRQGLLSDDAEVIIRHNDNCTFYKGMGVNCDCDPTIIANGRVIDELRA